MSDCVILSVVPKHGFSVIALDTLRNLASTLKCRLLVASDSDSSVHDDELVLFHDSENEFAARNHLLGAAEEDSDGGPYKYVIFGDLTSVNDHIDFEGVRNSLQILEAGLLDVATANQQMFFFDRMNFVKKDVAAPWRSFMASSAIVPVVSSYGGLAVYRRNSIGTTRFRNTGFVDFNRELASTGAKIAIVPWMVNSGHDAWWLMATIIVMVTLFLICLIVRNFLRLS